MEVTVTLDELRMLLHLLEVNETGRVRCTSILKDAHMLREIHELGHKQSNRSLYGPSSLEAATDMVYPIHHP